jgi:chromosome segregation protein
MPATEQERHAELEDAVIAAERRLVDAREQLRGLSARRRSLSSRPGRCWPGPA